MRKLCILRREGGVSKHFNLWAGSTTTIVYADHVEPPLRRWHTPQVIACDLRDFPPFVPIDRSFCRFHIARCSGLNFDKAKHILVPPDQIDLSTIFRRSIIPGYNRVAEFSQIEERLPFSTHSYAKMGWQLRWKCLQCAPIQHPDTAEGKHPKEIWEHPRS